MLRHRRKPQKNSFFISKRKSMVSNKCKQLLKVNLHLHNPKMTYLMFFLYDLDRLWPSKFKLELLRLNLSPLKKWLFNKNLIHCINPIVKVLLNYHNSAILRSQAEQYKSWQYIMAKDREHRTSVVMVPNSYSSLIFIIN